LPVIHPEVEAVVLVVGHVVAAVAEQVLIIRLVHRVVVVVVPGLTLRKSRISVHMWPNFNGGFVATGRPPLRIGVSGLSFYFISLGMDVCWG